MLHQLTNRFRRKNVPQENNKSYSKVPAKRVKYQGPPGRFVVILQREVYA